MKHQIDARFDALATVLIQAHPVRYYFSLHIARVLDMALRPRTETMPVEQFMKLHGVLRGLRPLKPCSPQEETQ